MIYLNNFIPIRIYYCKNLNVYRLLAPYADRPNLEYDEDFVEKKLKKVPYELINTIYVLNPRLFPPVPVGASMFSVFQNMHPPYQTRYIEWIAFPVMANVLEDIGNFSFYAFVNCPSKEAIPMYVRNEKDHTIISLDQKMIGDYFLKTPYYDKVLDRDNYILYVFPNVSLYWRATTECLCVPSDNPRDYHTLVECQRAVYHKTKNIRSFTGNSAIPLSKMRDHFFLSSTTKNNMYVYLLFVSIVSIFLYQYYTHRQLVKDKFNQVFRRKTQVLKN